MNKTLIKKAGYAALAGLLPLSATAGEVSISGWINEGVTYFDDGDDSGLYQNNENGHTLGSRITFSGSQDLGSGLSAGFEVILEPQSADEILGAGTSVAARGQSGFGDENIGYAPDITGTTGDNIRVLGNSLNVSGGFGKITVGLQSMPTDNIAVLEDPSLTLWSAISPIFVGNFTAIGGVTGAGAGASWSSFLNCGSGIGGIGIDCNGIYRRGVRYDLPAFGPVTVAVGAANNDVYDVAAKYKGEFGGVKTQLALGYAMINGTNSGINTGTDNFQMQLGLMDPGTGWFGSIAYQREDLDGTIAGVQDETDAFWTKVGIKKGFNSLGDTAISVNYGQYIDQYTDAALTGSEVERIGLEVNQYIGSAFILYGVWEMLDLDVDGDTTGRYAGADELNTFRLGATYFF